MLNYWDLIIVAPLINVVVVVSQYLFNSFGLTIIILTILIRAAMYPLTIKQLKATKAMQSIQTQVAELRKKYAKDRKQLAQEEMKLYRQSGMNPLGCLLPMLIQFPVWIALYQAIIKVLAAAPEDFLGLSKYLYHSWPVFSNLPLNSNFIWLDLASPDKLLLLPILVGGTMWVQQKMTTPLTSDPQQQAQSQMMLWTMPLLFAFLTLSFPSGLALYWLTSNVISIVMQYFVTGWGGLVTPKKTIPEKKTKGQAVQQLPAKAASAERTTPEEGLEHGKSGGTREDRGGSHPKGAKPDGGKPGEGGDKRRKGG